MVASPPSNTGSKEKARAAPLAALLLLSLLWAGSALRIDLLPNLFPVQLPHLESELFPLLCFALATALIAVIRRGKLPDGRTIRQAIVIGMGLFAVPALLVSLAAGGLPSPARTALFTLVPVFAVVFAPYIGARPATHAPGSLPAALLAVAAALLVFPVAMPDSAQTALAFVATVLAASSIAAANCYAVAATMQTGESSQQLIPIAAGSAAIVLASATILIEHPIWSLPTLAPELLWSTVIDAPALLSLFWLMPRLSAPRMATRYLLAPVLAIVMGVLLLQSLREVRPRTWLGLALMAAGAAWLLLAPASEPDPPASPLDLIGK
jgi:drug/metabolite transporter (DMT)-like permease